MTPQSGPIGSFCRIYSVLLYAYPRDFRLQYGAAMQQVFRDRCRDVARTAGPMDLSSVSPSTCRPTWLTTTVRERAAAIWSAGRKTSSPQLRHRMGGHPRHLPLRHHDPRAGLRDPHGFHGRHAPRGRPHAGGPRDFRRTRVRSAPTSCPIASRSAAISWPSSTRKISARLTSNASSACRAIAFISTINR